MEDIQVVGKTINKVIFFVVLLLCASAHGQIVNNSGTSSEDSITMFVVSLDSAGNMSTADSFYVRVFKSNANAVIYSDSGTCAGMTNVDSAVGRSHYYFRAAVADIDGSGAIGTYSLVVIARKTTGANLWTPNSMTFQITTSELSDAIDTIGIAYRQAKVATDTLALYDTRWDSTLSALGTDRSKYAMGSVWIGPTANTNTVSYVDGIITNPVSTIAAAKTVADNLKLRRFYTVRTGTVQIGAAMVGYDFDGGAWSLNTTGGSQDVSSSWFRNAKVIGGTYASTTAESHWDNCEFATGVTVAAAHMTGCTFQGTLTLSDTGSYDVIDGASVVAGPNTPTFDLGAAVGATDLGFRRWSGGLRLLNVQAGDTVSVDAVSGGKVRIHGTGGSVNVRGMVLVEDSSGGTVSIVKTQVINRTEIASAARLNILNDTTKTIGFKGGAGDSVLTPVGAAGASAAEVADYLADSSTGRVFEWGGLHLHGPTANDTPFVARTNAAAASSVPSFYAYSDSGVGAFIASNLSWGLAIQTQGSGQSGIDVYAPYGRPIMLSTDSGAPINLWNGGLGTTDFIQLQTPTDTIDLIDTLINTVNTEITKVKDTVNGLMDSIQLYDGRWALASELTKVTDTVNGLMDSIQLYDGRWALASELTKVTDTVNAISDTLQNASSTLRSTTVDTAAISASVKEHLFADTSKKIGFSGGVGDSVKAATTATVAGAVTLAAGQFTKIADTVGLDSAKFARSVWDNDVVARANRTIDEVDTVVLACVNGDTVSNAADFLKTLADYRQQIKRKLNIDISNSTYMTDSVMNQLIRESIVKVNPIMRGVKVKQRFVTSWQTSEYALDSLIGIIGVSWRKEDTLQAITYMPMENWGTLNNKSTFGSDEPFLSRPTVYDYTDNQIMLFPPPTLTDTIEITGFRKIHGIAVTSDVSAIPQAYRVPVLDYAAFLVAFSKQHPRAGDLLVEYKMSISDLMMSLNRRFNAETPSK